MKEIFQYLSSQVILVLLGIWIAFHLLVSKKRTGYGLTTADEFKSRFDKLARFLGVIYLSAFMLWGMFILPIKLTTGSIPTIRSLLFMLVAIACAYIAHRIIFYHKILIYIFSLAGSIFVSILLLQNETSLKEILTSAFL